MSAGSEFFPEHYLITPDESLETLQRHIEGAIAGGIGFLQIRAASLSTTALRQLLSRLMGFTDTAQCLINSHFTDAFRIAEEFGVGLHLQSAELMRLKQRPIGISLVAASCHGLEELQQAERLGLDFVVLSPVKKTRSHPLCQVLGWKRFEALVSKIGVPVIALGGMRFEDLAMAKKHGAGGIAGIGLFLDIYSS